MRKLFKDLADSFGKPSSPWALLALLGAAAAGYAAYLVHIPLAWVMGPLMVTAAVSIAGGPVFAPIGGRRFGQITIGSSIGLNITAGVALLMLYWLPAMVLTAVLAIFLAAVASTPFARLARIDGKTAYYSMMPGGLSEMANLGAAAGARSEPIAITQALRVGLLVCILPPLIVALGIHGTDTAAQKLPIFGFAATAGTLLIGLAGVLIARLVRFNNPWMIGPLVAVATATAAGLLVGHLPQPLYWFGQLLIGLSIGSRFKREFVVKLPRVFLMGAVFVLILAAALFGYASLMSRWTGLDLASATLGSSPGGLAEMAITAQTLHLSVGLVTGFHAVRAILVNGFSTHMYDWLDRRGFFALMRRISGSSADP